jgi:hypothetical protein
MKKLGSILFSTSALFTLLTTVVSAHQTGTIHSHTYDLTPEQAAPIFASFSIIWIAVMCCALIFGLAVYIFTSYQYAKIFEKNGMEDKKILAYIPIVQNYYLAKAVGEDEYAWVQIAIPVGYLVAFPLTFILIGICLMIPLAIAAIVFSVMLWMKASKRMGRDDIWGIAASLGGFIPLAGFFIQLYAIYYIAEGTSKK